MDRATKKCDDNMTKEIRKDRERYSRSLTREEKREVYDVIMKTKQQEGIVGYIMGAQQRKQIRDGMTPRKQVRQRTNTMILSKQKRIENVTVETKHLLYMKTEAERMKRK